MITEQATDSTQHGGGVRFEYQPALDGVRGLAVAAVLAFHLGISWMSGGYLGVSVFFTLSGFLITSLMLAEHDRRGRIDLSAFYQRRARRLIPAGLAVLGGVCLLVSLDLLTVKSTFSRQVFAAMFQFLNWTLLFEHQSYADLFRAPSPVIHYWSLGIEEQLYVLWPLALVVIVGFLRRRAMAQRLTAVVVAVWVLFALSAPITARMWSADAAYYATWARASEVLAGAVLAAILVGRRVAPWFRWVAPAALALMALLVVITPAGRGWPFEGGLPLFGALSAVALAGLQVPGPARSALSWRPLVWLGGISYGVYLFHWPIFLLVDEQWPWLHGLARDTVKVGITLVAAVVSYHLIEQPIRRRRVLPSLRTLVPGLAVAAMVVTALVVIADVPSAATSEAPVVITAAAPTEQAAGALPLPDAATKSAAAVAPHQRVVAMLGDSVPAWLLRDGAAGFTRKDVVVINGAKEACDAMIDMPAAQDRFGAVLVPPSDCQSWDVWYPKVLYDLTGDHTIDTAVLMIGQAPVLDHEVNGGWLPPCESIDWYLDDVAHRVGFLKAQGLQVVLAMPAPLGQRAIFSVPDDHPARMACVRAAMERFAAEHHVVTIDLADKLCPDGNCDALRTRDGVHVDPDHAAEVLDWVVASVLSVTGGR